ncbi:uncharacterized protein KY384_003593 [Bacidia gigantensis]|uniref:uncharacterized protein n=1 Tax=Bacidia gigantensis TaxID=2732470 RepID=UPI001D05B35D|nr:uncharacterized protein KY384_003593 [Bacidia gigantensis]KAG8531957.1 hypothetical protein KY384_003593 [Bacidia gigantensis]
MILISQLPTEILESIASLLNPANLCNLRSANKAVCKKVSASFGKACFATLSTDLSSQSLEKLDRVAATDHLRLHVQTLFLSYGHQSEFGNGLKWSRHQEGYLEKVQPSSQPLEDLLINKLPNCHSVYINSFQDSGDLTGELSVTDVVCIILSIIARSGLRIKSFTIDLCGQHPWNTSRGSGHLYAGRLPPYLDWQTSTFAEAWACLEELHFHQDLDPQITSFTRELIQLASGLKVLSLTGSYDDHSTIHPILRLKRPNLQKLYLRSAYIPQRLLLSFLETSKSTLRLLSLAMVYMEENGVWPAVFRTLRNDFPSLTAISLFYIKERYTEGEEDFHTTVMVFPTFFQRLLSSSIPVQPFDFTVKKAGLVGFDYTGPHMARVLQLLEECVEPLHEKSQAVREAHGRYPLP